MKKFQELAKKFEKKVTNEIKRRGWYIRRIQDQRETGGIHKASPSDYYVVLNGMHINIELKTTSRTDNAISIGKTFRNQIALCAEMDSIGNSLSYFIIKNCHTNKHYLYTPLELLARKNKTVMKLQEPPKTLEQTLNYIEHAIGTHVTHIYNNQYAKRFSDPNLHIL